MLDQQKLNKKNGGNYGDEKTSANPGPAAMAVLFTVEACFSTFSFFQVDNFIPLTPPQRMARNR